MIGIIYLLFAVVLIGLYNGLLLLDDKTLESDPKNKEIEKKWHTVGAALFLFISASAWYFFGWQYILLGLSAFWSLFGGIVHKVGLNKPFFFVGTTAKTDLMIRKVFPKKPELGSAIAKIGVLALSVLLIIIFK